MKQTLASFKKEILEAGERAYARGYVASNDGNISARLSKKHVLITPTGISKGFMKPSDLVVVDMNGKVVKGEKKPSSEIHMHIHIYQEREDVHSVCHVHPPYATGFAVAGIPLDQNILSEAVLMLGNVPLVEYATPGTEELFSHLQPLLKNHNAFLLANHGALTVGKDIFEAYKRMETLEHTAKIIFIAARMGKVNTLRDEDVKKLEALREKFKVKISSRL